MTISGNLLDVTVADVMQFVHLGGRTGTLVMEQGGERAEIGFHRGRIISAWTPKSERLGDLLLRREMMTQEQLASSLAEQEERVPKVSLGKILVTRNIVSKDELRDVIAEQIEQTIYELVTWTSGNFEFALNELRPVDDIAVYPGDILPDINLNTQIVVLEALRIFDERNRDRSGGETETEAEPEPEIRERSTSALEDEGTLDDLVPASEDATQDDFESIDLSEETDDSAVTRFQVVTEDRHLTETLLLQLPTQNVSISEVEIWDAGLTLPGETPPVVLMDMRHRSIEVADLEAFCRSRTHASILTIAADAESTSQLYEIGALAVLPPDAEAINSCLTSVLRSRRGRASIVGEQFETNAGFAKLRRVVADLRSGLLSATVALNLMQVISESVERAIMFVVRNNELVALGAFGNAGSGAGLAQATHGVRIPLEPRSALAEVLADGRARSLQFEDADLPPEFMEQVGKPRTGQIVLFPVVGSSQVNSLVYTDNGPVSREIEEIEILELAAAQVGVAFENEILRRKMDRLDTPPVARPAAPAEPARLEKVL